MSCFKSSNDKSPKTKHITVYLNGFRTEKNQIILDTKNKSKWYHILNDITNKIQPYFGVVKKLYSSESGVTICSFSDIEDYGSYVASDNKAYQILKGGYDEKSKKKHYEHYLTGQLNRNNRLRKLSYVRRDLIVIFVYNNGKDRDQPVKVVLSREDLLNWPQTLSFIALVADVPSRCLKALYNSKGHKICGAWELQHGASYIAVGYNEKFIPRNYNIRENTTEIWKAGIPIVHRDKNEICSHEYLPKSWKQNLEWKRSMEEFYNYSPLQIKERPKFAKSWTHKCSCHRRPSSSSESSNNTLGLFSMSSDYYRFLNEHNSKLKTPLSTSYEKTLYSKKYVSCNPRCNPLK